MILRMTFNNPKINSTLIWIDRITVNNPLTNFKIQIIITSPFNKPNLAHFLRIIKPNRDMHIQLTKFLSMQINYHIMKIFHPIMDTSRTFTNQQSRTKLAFKGSWVWIKWVFQKIQNGILRSIIKNCFNSKMNMFLQTLIFPTKLHNIKDLNLTLNFWLKKQNNLRKAKLNKIKEKKDF